MVVTIIGIVVAFAVPRFPIAAIRADAAVRVVRGELQAAQRGAITRQSNIVVAGWGAGRPTVRVAGWDLGCAGGCRVGCGTRIRPRIPPGIPRPTPQPVPPGAPHPSAHRSSDESERGLNA